MRVLVLIECRAAGFLEGNVRQKAQNLHESASGCSVTYPSSSESESAGEFPRPANANGFSGMVEVVGF
jgi:hypothetical protein